MTDPQTFTPAGSPQLGFAAMKRVFDANDHDAGRPCLTVGCTECGGPTV